MSIYRLFFFIVINFYKMMYGDLVMWCVVQPAAAALSLCQSSIHNILYTTFEYTKYI